MIAWVDTIKEVVLEQLVTPLLRKHFPGGIPQEVLDAVLPEVDKVFAGEPVNWFQLRRLILSVTNEAVAKVQVKL